MMGERLSHYRLLEKIGTGGMGEVYCARDERLERDVAIKMLPPPLVADADARRRLRNEARALSQLNHPNIATVFDLDSDGPHHFIVMEWVPGETLDERVSHGPFDEREVIDLAAQIAEALTAAHEAGVVHRDLKPGNLRVTPSGRLKVLDFGIAQRITPGDETMTVTDVESTAGTLAYMAPELLAGGGDARADLYSLGVVLYELSTGSRPFAAPTASQLMHAILAQTVVAPRVLNPAISSDLQAIILRLLERDPARRYPSARALREALAAFRDGPRASTGSAGSRTIAVLPLENLSGDPSQEYFADGMTEALIGDLARMRELRVISRTSIMRYKGVRRAIPEIAAELNVETILEGSVLRSGDRLRVSVQLIDARSDSHLWAERYDRAMEDVLSLQSEVASAVAGEIRAALLVPDDAGSHGSATGAGEAAAGGAAGRAVVNPEAYDLYLRGRYHLNRRSYDSLNRAIETFEAANTKDPSYALAHLGLAEAHALLAFHEFAPPYEEFPRALATAEQALALAPDLGEAYAVLGYVQLHHDRDWAAAERSFVRAIDLNANHAVTRLWYVNLLAEAARFGEAHEQCRRALELDPLSIILNLVHGWVRFFERDFGPAFEEMGRALELEPGFFQAHQWRGFALWQTGRVEEASRHLETAAGFTQHEPTALFLRAMSTAIAGRTEEGRALAARLEAMRAERYVSAFSLALVRIALGDLDAAVPWIEKAAEERSAWVGFMRVDPRMDAVRHDPRIEALCAGIGTGS